MQKDNCYLDEFTDEGLSFAKPQEQEQTFTISDVKFSSILELLPECYQQNTLANLECRLAQNKKLTLYYDGVLINSTATQLSYHLQNILRLKFLFPSNMALQIVVGVSKSNDPKLSGESMALLQILHKNPLVSEIIYPAPWFATVAFLDDKNIDFCFQNPSPLTTIRGYDLYRDLKKEGRFFPLETTPNSLPEFWQQDQDCFSNQDVEGAENQVFDFVATKNFDAHTLET